MSDTHINVYFQNVEDAKQKLAVAKGDLDHAKVELEAKKQEIGFEDPKTDEPREVQQERPSQSDVERTAARQTGKEEDHARTVPADHADRDKNTSHKQRNK